MEHRVFSFGNKRLWFLINRTLKHDVHFCLFSWGNGEGAEINSDIWLQTANRLSISKILQMERFLDFDKELLTDEKAAFLVGTEFGFKFLTARCFPFFRLFRKTRSFMRELASAGYLSFSSLRLKRCGQSVKNQFLAIYQDRSSVLKAVFKVMPTFINEAKPDFVGNSTTVFASCARFIFKKHGLQVKNSGSCLKQRIFAENKFLRNRHPARIAGKITPITYGYCWSWRYLFTVGKFKSLLTSSNLFAQSNTPLYRL